MKLTDWIATDRPAASVWGRREDNPWLGLVLDTVGAQIGAPVPPPDVPGPFSLDDPSRLERLLVDAGFDGVVVEAIPTPLRAPSFDVWWERTSAVAGPLAATVAGIPNAARDALTERSRVAVRPYSTRPGSSFPVSCSSRRLAARDPTVAPVERGRQ